MTCYIDMHDYHAISNLMILSCQRLFHDNSRSYCYTMYMDIRYYHDHLVSQPPNVYIYVLNLEPFYARTVLCQVRYLDFCELNVVCLAKVRGLWHCELDSAQIAYRKTGQLHVGLQCSIYELNLYCCGIFSLVSTCCICAR